MRLRWVGTEPQIDAVAIEGTDHFLTLAQLLCTHQAKGSRSWRPLLCEYPEVNAYLSADEGYLVSIHHFPPLERTRPAMSTVPTLRLAVCLFPDLTLLDFIGPVQVFGLLQQKFIKALATLYPAPPTLQLEATYFSHDLTPVVGDVGPALIPQKTYKEVLENFEQYDLILIPGGESQLVNSSSSLSDRPRFSPTGVRAEPEIVDPSLIEFVKRQAPGAKYILTVCTGSWILAGTGLLNGKKATTNKAFFKRVVVRMKVGCGTLVLINVFSSQAATDKSIEWVPQARWVVDGNIWTSSGVTAGTHRRFDPAHVQCLLYRFQGWTWPTLSSSSWLEKSLRRSIGQG